MNDENEEQDENEEKKDLYAVFAEVEDSEHPLILINLTFARLIDDVVFPYEEDKPFFIDGVPLTRKKIKRLKILRQKDHFLHLFFDLHGGMRQGNKEKQKIYGQQYHVRLEAALREGCEDVTSQIIKAFDAKIRPRLKEYLVKRPELIQATYQAFLTGIKILSDL